MLLVTAAALPAHGQELGPLEGRVPPRLLLVPDDLEEPVAEEEADGAGGDQAGRDGGDGPGALKRDVIITNHH